MHRLVLARVFVCGGLLSWPTPANRPFFHVVAITLMCGFVFFLGQLVFRSTLGVDFVGTFVLPLRVGISVGCWISCSTIMCGYLFCFWISLIEFYQILYLLLFRVMVEQKYQLSVHAKLSSYAWGECLRIFMSAIPGCHCHDIWFWLVSSLLKSFPSLFTTLVYLSECVY